MSEQSFTINTNVAISTSTYNQEITMNKLNTSIVTPVDAGTLTDKIRHAGALSAKLYDCDDYEYIAINNEIECMELLRSIINKHEGLADNEPCTNKLIPAVADVVTRDAAQTAIDELGWRLAKTAAGGRSWAKVAKACGYSVMGDETCVTLSIRFTPGDKDAYLRHSDNMRSLIGRCPRTQGGSTWGDDGIATRINEENGSITLNTSGVSKRFVAGLR